jgi:predicted PurR-regulated permease PerM
MSTSVSRPEEDSQPETELTRVHVWRIQAVRDVLLIIAVLAVLRLGYEMSAITVPLLVALGLAYLFEPVITAMQSRWRWRRTTAVSVILAFFISVVVLVVVPVSLVVVGQTASFVRNAAGGKYANAFDKGLALLPQKTREDVESARDWLEDTLPWSARIFGDDVSAEGDVPSEPTTGDSEPPSAATVGSATESAPSERTVDAEDLQRLVAAEVSRQLALADRDSFGGLLDTPETAKGDGQWSFGSSALDMVGAGARRLWGLALGVVELGLLVFLVPFYFFFFAVSYPKVLRFTRDLVPAEHRDEIFRLVAAMDRAVSGFVRGRLVISAILGTVFAIGWLVVGVPYSLALGLVVGVFCAVPYLSVIGVPVAIGLLAVDQVSMPEAERYAWWGILLWPTVVYGIGQTLDDWVLTPMIQGKATDLDPVSIVVAVLAGGSLAGVYGMLLAVPAAACVKILIRELVMPRVRAWSEGRARDPLPGG